MSVWLLLALACKPIGNDTATSSDDTDVADTDTDVADTDTDVADTDTDVDTDTGTTDTDTDGGDTGTPPAGAHWTGSHGTDDAAAVLRGDRQDDLAGYVVSTGDVDGDGQTDLLVTAPYSDETDNASGVAYLVLGPITSSMSLSAADAVVAGPAGHALLGWAAAIVPDVDGDGKDDVAVGAPGDSTPSSGQVWLLHGPLSGDVDLATAAGHWTGESSDGDSSFGYALAACGDVDGDGKGDFIVGAPRDSTGKYQAGAAYVFHGKLTGTNASSAVGRIYGEVYQKRFGGAVAGAGDIDGDGLDDVMITGGYGTTSGEAVYVHAGPVSGGFLGATDALATLVPSNVAAQFSTHQARPLAALGDVDGDGYDDVAVATPDEWQGSIQNAGEVFVVHGPLSGTMSLALADGRILGDATDELFGWDLAPGPDLDGDGGPDLMVTRNDVGCGTDCGAVDLVPADFTGVADAGDVAVATFHGSTAYASMGVPASGDLDGDGVLDLAVGAYGDVGDATHSGDVWLYLGGGL